MNPLGWLLCLAAVVVLGGGCFNPDYGPGGFACLEGQCPEGYDCVGGVCRKVGSSTDLALDVAVDGPSLDLKQPDGGADDLAPDLSTLEASADLPLPDLPWDSGKPDQAPNPDLALPDAKQPDLPAPDMQAPDMQAPDMQAPDQAAPNPDLALPDAKLPDSTPGDSGPPKVNIVFVTSNTVVPGALGGLSGADLVCKARATTAGLKGTYKAFLSSSTLNAPSRLAGARGWMRTDGKLVLDQTSTLSTGLKWYPINLTESGAKMNTKMVVTATSASMSPSSNTCSDWTVTSSSTSGGSTSGLGSRWTAGLVPKCGNHTVMPRLYCFGVDHNTKVTPPVTTGRKAFLSTATFKPGLGLVPADAICQSEALGAGLSGTFRALLATANASALSRFKTTGGPWVRTDGLPLGNLYTSSSLETSLHVHANGTSYSLGGWVWTGASNGTGVGTSTCSSWTSSSTTIKGSLGSSAEVGYFYYGLALSCDRSYPVYCLQD